MLMKRGMHEGRRVLARGDVGARNDEGPAHARREGRLELLPRLFRYAWLGGTAWAISVAPDTVSPAEPLRLGWRLRHIVVQRSPPRYGRDRHDPSSDFLFNSGLEAFFRGVYATVE